MADELHPCPYCGKEFEHNNAGARSNHVDSCKEENDGEPHAQQQNQQAQQPRQPQQQAQRGGGQVDPDAPARQAERGEVPARRQQGQQQAQGGEIQTMDQQQAMEAGMQVGTLLSGSASGDPGQQAQAKGKLLQTVAGAAAKMGQTIAQRGEQQHQRAQQNAGRDTKKSQDYPTCAECGAQLTQLPPEAEQGEAFPCGSCGAVLELV
jgi:predicted RNA-binding Zn-ribbon protein involved in translation (DUF1610 family)